MGADDNGREKRGRKMEEKRRNWRSGLGKERTLRRMEVEEEEEGREEEGGKGTY